MNKFWILISLLILSGCSFDTKSGIWTQDEDIQKVKKELDKTMNFINEAWMDMMYEGKNSEYYDKFAKDNNEEDLLRESDYVLLDLDEYSIELPNGNYRYWIYEKELSDVIDILREKKLTIQNHISEFNVRAGVTLALLAMK